jgi:hypothetical protein
MDWNNERFKPFYRMTQENFKLLVDLGQGEIKKQDTNEKSVSVKERVLIMLYFYSLYFFKFSFRKINMDNRNALG